MAQSANKPMIIDEVSGQRPISARNDFLSRMFAQVQAAGSPVVGEVSKLYLILSAGFVGLAGDRLAQVLQPAGCLHICVVKACKSLLLVGDMQCNVYSTQATGRQ